MNKHASTSLRRVAILIGIVVLAAGVAALVLKSSQSAEQPTRATIENIPYDVRVSVAPSAVAAGETASVRLRVLQNSQPVDLEETGRLFHVIIVSANLRDTFHTYSPARVARGVYDVPHTFTEAGRYRIWTEVDDTAAKQRHDQYAERIGYAEVTVKGDAAVEPAAPITEKTVGSYQVRLVTAPIVAGKPTTLRVAVTDKAGKPVPLFAHEPFLYFMSGENFSFFRHGHGVTLQDGSAGLENTFPTAGKYVWWLQLQLVKGDAIEVLQVPFLLTVPQGI